MPRPKRDQARPNMAEEVKRVARTLMRVSGTAGLTLRGIAREMNVTAPAIYHYFPSLDDLTTALVVDGFLSIGLAIESAIETAAPQGLIAQLVAGVLAYRTWALEHPTEFQLIYGNPIPGYVAPEDITNPAARRPLAAIGRVLAALHAEGHIHPKANYASVPPSIAVHLE